MSFFSCDRGKSDHCAFRDRETALKNEMKKRKYFKIRTREDNPMVIKRIDNYHTSYTFEQRIVTGVYYRVHPSIADYTALCMMEHRVEKFAPAVGNGVIIRADVLKALDAEPA